MQTRIHVDLDNRIGGQNTNETRNEPEFTSDEFKEHLAKLNLRKTPGTNGIRPELIVYIGERLHTLLLKLFNKCWMGKQNIPRAWVVATVLPIYKRKGSRSVPSSYNTITIQRNLLDIHGILSFTYHLPYFITSKYFIEKVCGRISPFRKYVFY